MRAWLQSYSSTNKIKGIADGNADISKYLKITSDKSLNFMGLRSSRFAMIIENNIIIKKFVEKSGDFGISSAESILSKL